jgi:hypothetical protein
VHGQGEPVTRRGFFSGSAAALLLGAISKQWRRPEWKPAHVKLIKVLDDIAPTKIVVDPYCPLSWLVVMGGCVFCSPENVPPWPPDTSVQWGHGPRFSSWSMPA